MKNQCSECGELKDISDFIYRKDRNVYEGRCKDCRKVYRKEWYFQKNKTFNRKCTRCGKSICYVNLGELCSSCLTIERNQNNRIYRTPEEKRKNKERWRIFNREYARRRRKDPNYLEEQRQYSKKKRADPIGHEKLKESVKKYRQTEKGKAKVRELDEKRRKLDSRKEWMKEFKLRPHNTIRHRLCERLRCALKRQGLIKKSSIANLIGCTIPELKNHISKQFLPGMTWKNMGEWHIDHIIPCAVFDLTDPKQQKQCFHYTNLQPLWAIDNLKKSAKIA